MRDDRPFAGGAPPAALYRFSRDRRGEHPQAHLAGWSGILQSEEDQRTVQWTVCPTNAYAGFGGLYDADRQPEPITEALCWAHARRKFFELADIAASARCGKPAPPVSPTALEAVKRIDAIFDAERPINGLAAEARLSTRRADVAPLIADLEAWMRRERAALSRHAPVAKAMDYMLRRWDGFAGVLADGRACLTNNAAERALRGVAMGRKAWLFAGSGRGGDGRARRRGGEAARQDRPAGGRAGFFSQGLRTMSVARRREMIEPQNPRLSVVRQCALVGISRSAAYGPKGGESPLNLVLRNDSSYH